MELCEEEDRLYNGRRQFCVAGNDWIPGQMAKHKSLIAFKKELADKAIKLYTSKIRNILITGG